MSIRYRYSSFRTTVKYCRDNLLPLHCTDRTSHLSHTKTRKVLIIDRKVWELHSSVFKKIAAGDRVFFIDALEKNKNLNLFVNLLNFLTDKNLSRTDQIIAAGGGITLDIAGFAASVFKRGCRLIFIPTTFVGMIDASVGGKNGINHVGTGYHTVHTGTEHCSVRTSTREKTLLIKNLIGSYYPPEYTYINEQFLETLSREDLLNGWAECIKVSLLIPNKLYASILRHLRKDPTDTPLPTKSIIRDAVTLKEKLCRNDIYDRSERRKLNLGHTFAHLIETATDFNIPHGTAVALGIRAAAKLSLSMGRIDMRTSNKINEPLNLLGFPERIPEEYLRHIQEKGLSILDYDKKQSTKIRAVIFSGFQNSSIITIDDGKALINTLLES